MADIVLGVILGSYGVRGQVRIKSFTENPLDIASYGELLDGEGRIYNLLNVRLQKGDRVIGGLVGCDNRDQADSLRGIALHVEREALGDVVSDGETFYHVDLVGLLVRDERGVELGKIGAIYNYGGGDLLDIALTLGGTVMINFTKLYIPDIVRDSHVVVSDEGLLALGMDESKDESNDDSNDDSNDSIKDKVKKKSTGGDDVEG